MVQVLQGECYQQNSSDGVTASKLLLLWRSEHALHRVLLVEPGDTRVSFVPNAARIARRTRRVDRSQAGRPSRDINKISILSCFRRFVSGPFLPVVPYRRTCNTKPPISHHAGCAHFQRNFFQDNNGTITCRANIYYVYVMYVFYRAI